MACMKLCKGELRIDIYRIRTENYAAPCYILYSVDFVSGGGGQVRSSKSDGTPVALNK